MNETLYPKPNKALAERRRDVAPDAEAAFGAFSKTVFQDGALSRKTKQLIAVAVAHVTQCPICVAAEIRAGGAYAHSALALTTLDDEDARDKGSN